MNKVLRSMLPQLQIVNMCFRWSDGSTDNPLTVTVNQNITLTANFIKRRYSFLSTLKDKEPYQKHW